MPDTIRIDIDDRKLVALMAATKNKKPTRIIADGVEYGVYVEFGSSRNNTGPRPAAKNASEAVLPDYIKAMGQIENWAVAERVTDKAALDVQRLWQQGIRDMDAIDTGAYLNSIHVVEGESTSVEFESIRR